MLKARRRSLFALSTPWTVARSWRSQVFDAAVGQGLAQLCLALQRVDQQLVVGAVAGAQVEGQEGLLGTAFGVLLSRRAVADDLEIAAEARCPVGAFLGALADDDPEGVVGAAAAAALAGELDRLGALGRGLHAVAVDADQGRTGGRPASASTASDTARDTPVRRSLIASTLNTGRGKDAAGAIERGLSPRPNIIWGMSEHRLPERDRPWVMRTYAGHSDARRSNELYRGNLAKGQTGLSVAFDLPTQTGYDPDHVLARGEVGKVGVSVAHRGDMETAARPDPARRR